MNYNDNIRPELINLKPQLVACRHYLHQHPELSAKEYETQAYILNFLKKEGIECKEMGTTGVIGTIHGAKKGKVIALRADMDALPVTEKTGAAFSSVKDGVMHACGHDGHMAILLFAAKLINQSKSSLKGSVRLIFQPAEENIGGAERMISEGCLKNPSVEEIYGLHLWGAYPTGEIRTKSGPIMATNNEIKVTITGKSGHGAMPHQGIDSIVVAAQFISSIQTIVARNTSPFSSSVITFGTIEGGSAPNVIAPEVRLRGTIRSMSDEDKALLVKRIDEVLKGTCQAFNCQGELEVVHEGAYITLVNDHQRTENVLKIAKNLVGDSLVGEAYTMGAEDFSYYANELPACYFFVGAGNEEKRIIYPQHHSKFDLDDDSLLIGTEMFVRICGL